MPVINITSILAFYAICKLPQFQRPKLFCLSHVVLRSAFSTCGSWPFQGRLQNLSQGSSKTITEHNFILWFATLTNLQLWAAMKLILLLASPQHEALYQMAAALWRVRTTALGYTFEFFSAGFSKASTKLSPKEWSAYPKHRVYGTHTEIPEEVTVWDNQISRYRWIFNQLCMWSGTFSFSHLWKNVYYFVKTELFWLWNW